MVSSTFVIFVSLLCFTVAGPLEFDTDDDRIMHPDIDDTAMPSAALPEEQQDPNFWKTRGMERAKHVAKNKQIRNKAKNVIMFLGDGMSVPTVTAARIYKGQLDGQTGEEAKLSFEDFPTTGFSKTYCVNRQVPDSACTATAYLGGVKANYGTIGVTHNVPRRNCELMLNTSNHVESIAKLFKDNGKGAGFVTTTRVTHASPAGTYAHTADREWESDTYVMDDGQDPLVCKDIAYQLIHGDTGKDFNVMLGGGRREFRDNSVRDEEGTRGRRSDGRDLINEWITQNANADRTSEYVWNKNQLMNVSSNTDYLLGLFKPGHMLYRMEGRHDTEPSFEEMVEAAIKVLSKNDNGFFLFAEGGKIDRGHHGAYAKLALDETVEFAKGVEKALSMTDEEDTLIVVTADHSHVMTMSGYPTRGNTIIGVNDRDRADDGLRYLTLSYANGPGYRKEVDGNRIDVAEDDMSSIYYTYPSMVPLESETHGGDDVGVYANGPWNHLFAGVYEQSDIRHIMTYASCLDEDFSACD